VTVVLAPVPETTGATGLAPAGSSGAQRDVPLAVVSSTPPVPPAPTGPKRTVQALALLRTHPGRCGSGTSVLSIFSQRVEPAGR
jgi:hypothetical protein